ncbi:MAG: hypothetical protein Altm1KO_05810 [Alteromonas macleodii]
MIITNENSNKLSWDKMDNLTTRHCARRTVWQGINAGLHGPRRIGENP